MRELLFAEKITLIREYRSLSLNNASMKTIHGISLHFAVLIQIGEEKHLLGLSESECAVLFTMFKVNDLRELFSI